MSIHALTPSNSTALGSLSYVPLPRIPRTRTRACHLHWLLELLGG